MLFFLSSSHTVTAPPPTRFSAGTTTLPNRITICGATAGRRLDFYDVDGDGGNNNNVVVVVGGGDGRSAMRVSVGRPTTAAAAAARGSARCGSRKRRRHRLSHTHSLSSFFLTHSLSVSRPFRPSVRLSFTSDDDNAYRPRILFFYLQTRSGARGGGKNRRGEHEVCSHKSTRFAVAKRNESTYALT